jgi:hypothetical protein
VSRSQLVGKWAFDYSSSLSKMDTKAQFLYQSMDAVRKSKLEQAYSGRQFVFTSDGSMTQQLADGRAATGSWRLSADGLQLELVDVQNKAQSFVIKQSTETTLVLEVVSQGITKMLLSEWHLIKH